MESNFDEDVSALSKSQIKERRFKLNRDKRYINYKILYWNRQYKQIRDLEHKLIKRDEELKDVCEVCGYKRINKEETKLRTLPDGRQVCKPCWDKIVDETFIQNIEIISRTCNLKKIKKEINTNEEFKNLLADFFKGA